MTADDLEKNTVYFECARLCHTRPVPEIKSWVYIGANLSEEDKQSEISLHYFQDPESFFKEQLLASLTQQQKTEYNFPEQPGRMIVFESNIEGIIYNLLELKRFVSEIGSGEYDPTIFKLA